MADGDKLCRANRARFFVAISQHRRRHDHILVFRRHLHWKKFHLAPPGSVDGKSCASVGVLAHLEVGGLDWNSNYDPATGLVLRGKLHLRRKAQSKVLLYVAHTLAYGVCLQWISVGIHRITPEASGSDPIGSSRRVSLVLVLPRAWRRCGARFDLSNQ